MKNIVIDWRNTKDALVDEVTRVGTLAIEASSCIKQECGQYVDPNKVCQVQLTLFLRERARNCPKADLQLGCSENVGHVVFRTDDSCYYKTFAIKADSHLQLSLKLAKALLAALKEVTPELMRFWAEQHLL